MKTALALGAALIALAACHNNDGGNEANGSNAALAAPGAEANGAGESDTVAGNAVGGAAGGASSPAASTDGMQLEPGEWETTTQVLTASNPMRPGPEPIPEPLTRRRCMSEAESRHLAESFFGALRGEQCSRREFTMRGGRIEGHLACTTQRGRSTADVTGDYTRTTFSFMIDMAGLPAGASRPAQMRTRISARRVGACPAGAQQRETPAR